MISAHSIVQHGTLAKRYLSHSEKEGPWCIQLSGNDPELMYEATKVAASLKPDLLDLNCGCPKPKIRKKGCGSAQFDSLETLEEVIKAMKQASNLPLTVKIRVAGNTNDERYLQAASLIERSGADAIIVHGRHFSEDYDVLANYSQIRRLVSRVDIPVIANGDVFDQQSLQKCLKETSADAVMIARGSIGRPWLFQQLHEGMPNPSIHEVIRLFKYHIDCLVILEESERVALLQARRFLKWYFPDLNKIQLSFCYETEDLKSLYNKLQSFFV